MAAITPAEALAAQRARDAEEDARHRRMVEKIAAARRAAEEELVELAAAVLLGAGHGPSVRDEQGYITSSGWTVRARTGGAFVQAEPEHFTAEQTAAMKAASTHKEWMEVTDACDQARYAGVCEALAQYRAAFEAAGWDVRMFHSESVWIIGFEASPAAKELSEQGS